MGTMHHHAVVVTGWQKEGVDAAHGLALGLFPWVSPVSPQVVNGYSSFFIPPDGSKEGWEESDHGDEQREAFFNGLKNLEKANLYVNVVEVGFGELGMTARDPLGREEEHRS